MNRRIFVIGLPLCGRCRTRAFRDGGGAGRARAAAGDVRACRGNAQPLRPVCAHRALRRCSRGASGPCRGRPTRRGDLLVRLVPSEQKDDLTLARGQPGYRHSADSFKRGCSRRAAAATAPAARVSRPRWSPLGDPLVSPAIRGGRRGVDDPRSMGVSRRVMARSVWSPEWPAVRGDPRAARRRSGGPRSSDGSLPRRGSRTPRGSRSPCSR